MCWFVSHSQSEEQGKGVGCVSHSQAEEQGKYVGCESS